MNVWRVFAGPCESSRVIFETDVLQSALQAIHVLRMRGSRERLALHLWRERIGLAVCLVEFSADGDWKITLTPEALDALAELPEGAIEGMPHTAFQLPVFVRRSIHVC